MKSLDLNLQIIRISKTGLLCTVIYLTRHIYEALNCRDQNFGDPQLWLNFAKIRPKTSHSYLNKLKNDVTDSITKAEILAVRKYGDIFRKRSHFEPNRYVLYYGTRKYPRPRGKQYHGLYAFKNLFNLMMKSKK